MQKTLYLQVMILYFVFIFIFVGCTIADQPKRTTVLPPHHTPKGFRNPDDHSKRGFGAFLRWQLGWGPQETPAISPKEIRPYKPQIVPPNLNRIKNPDSTQIQITWIGHATFLIQVAGINILTDPIFSERASPVSFAGPKRLPKPGINFEDLPEIHAVVISHNHYDHLDAATVQRLGNNPKYLVPLGLVKWFNKKGINNVVELDWWQFHTFAGLNFHSVPIQHFSGRSPFDSNETLWSGWVIESELGKIFFAGDTGYSPVFMEIGNRFGPIKVAMIPIGAFSPRWFMGSMHVDPPEAIKIHKDVQSEQSIAMHWGTFDLTDEPLGEPPLYLKKALQAAGIDEEKFIIMKFGETLTF